MIQIGAIKPIASPSNYAITPDDRQEKVETIGGVVVLDYGRVSAGDTYKFTCRFYLNDWQTLQGYWVNRTKITFVDAAGTAHNNCRVKVTGIKDVQKFPNILEIDLEIWMV